MHAAILVIGDYVDDQLLPFDENLQVDPYTVEIEEFDLDLFLHFYQKDTDITGFSYKEKYEAVKFIYNRKGLEWNNDTWEFDDDKLIVSDRRTYNPDGRWDWYEIGGRFSNTLTTKTNEEVNNCLISELDFNKTFEGIYEDGPAGLICNFEWFDSDNYYKLAQADYPELLRKDMSWLDFVIELIQAYPNENLTIVDTHY